MDEYIKREDAMKALEEYRLSHTMSMHGDHELLMEFRDGVIGAMNALSFVPAADVAPKSEIAYWMDTAANAKKEAVYEFAEKLKNYAEVVTTLSDDETILAIQDHFVDEVTEEMIGEQI